jgi:hypothetical protein
MSTSQLLFEKHAAQISRVSLLMVACLGLAAVAVAKGQSLATAGCPISHCTPEATGVILQSLIPAVLATNSNSALGSLHAEGCSGNGIQLSCLFVHDSVRANYKGTLKLLDATTLQPIWGSGSVRGSYDLDPDTAALGQVPVNFADGSLAAGDAQVLVHYNSSGVVLAKTSVGGTGNDFGLTPVSNTYGIVSQGDGTMTLINLSSWKNVATLTLLDPRTQTRMNLVGPSSAGTDVLYAIGYSNGDNDGTLFAIAVDESTGTMSVRSTFSFTGQSGAAPVVVTPAQSGLPNNLVLLHVPGLIGEAHAQNHLLGLSDVAATGLEQTWAIPLNAPLTVSPSVDQNSGSLFYEAGPYLYQSDLVSGAAIHTFDLETIGGFNRSFHLTGHIAASQAGSVFTLLLSGTFPTTKNDGVQYAMAFQPIASPNALVWSSQIASVNTGYSAAWNFAPSTLPGVVCPIAITVTSLKSTIIRLCDH